MENLENQTANNAGNNTETDSGNDKMFTQEEVDKIVQARLARVKGNEPTAAEKSLEERERAVAAKEHSFAHKATLKEKNIPEEVYEALNCTSDETFNKSVEILGPYFQRLNEPIMNPVTTVRNTGNNGDSIRKAMGL